MICFALGLALLFQAVDFRLTPAVVRPHDSYEISVPVLAGKTIDLRYHFNGGDSDVAESFCQLDGAGKCRIQLKPGLPRPGTVQVTGVRAHGSKEWLATQAEIRVLDEELLPAAKPPARLEAQPARAAPAGAPAPAHLDWAAFPDLGPFGPLLARVLALLSIWCAGRWLLERLRVSFPEPAERAAFSWALGCLGIGIASFIIALLGMAYRPVFFGLAVAALFAGRKFIPRPRQIRALFDVLLSPQSWLQWLFVLIGAPFALVYLIAAMAPETSPDALSYHLGFLKIYLTHHRLEIFPHNFYNALPAGMEMAFLFCSALGGYVTARLAHLLCLFALMAAVYMFARRIGLGRFAAFPPLILLATPVLAESATQGVVDAALTLALFLAFYAAYNWRASGEKPMLVLAGLLAGLAMSIKPTGAIAAALVLLMVLWPGSSVAGLARRLRAALLVAMLAGAIVSPWLIRNSIGFQNPIMPIGNRFFPNAQMLPSSEAGLVNELRHFGGFGRQPGDYWKWPGEVTLQGRRLQGIVGPFFLLAPLALLALGKRDGRWLLAAAAIGLSPHYANVLVRFLVTGLPFLALAVMLGLRPLLRFRIVVAALTLLLIAQAVLATPWVITARGMYTGVRAVPLAAALHPQSQRDYLLENLPAYSVIEFVEDHTPPDSRVFTFGQLLYQAYTSRPLLFPWGSEQMVDVMEILERGRHSWYAPDRRFQTRFDPRAATAVRLINPGQNSRAWPICEVDLLDGDGRAIDPGSLSYSASVNPFAASQAGDGRPMSCWSAHAPVGAGAWFEIKIRGSKVISGIRYLTSDLGADYPAALFIAGSDGELQRLDVPFKDIQLPKRNWRPEASEMLKLYRVDYLAFDYLPGHPYVELFNDLLKHKEDWRLHEVYQEGSGHLLKVMPEGGSACGQDSEDARAAMASDRAPTARCGPWLGAPASAGSLVDRESGVPHWRHFTGLLQLGTE